MDLRVVASVMPLALCGSGTTHETTSSRAGLGKLSICELVSHPERHHMELVRVEAIMAFHPEGGFLYDPACDSPDSWIWPEADPVHVPDPTLWQHASLRKEESARVVLLGRFEGPNGEGYGHLGGFRQQIVVQREEEIAKVVPRTPGPQVDAPAPLRRMETELRQLDDRWFAAVAVRDAASLDRLLSEDYLRVDPSGEVAYKPQVVAAPCHPHMSVGSSTRGAHRNRTTFSQRIRVYVRDPVAIVTRSIERPGDSGSAAPSSHASDQYEYVNVYARRAGGWKLVISHLSHCSGEERDQGRNVP